MLRHLLVMHSSGTVLYSKEIFNGLPPTNINLLGSIFTALFQLCRDCTGHPVSYVEMAAVAVSFSFDPKYGVACALLHDKDDGQAFGEVLAMEILRVFTESFGGVLSGAVLNVSQFSSFYVKIAEGIQNAMRPILRDLSNVNGIELCALTVQDSLLYSTQPLEQLAFVANLQALMSYATDLLGMLNDRLVSAVLMGQRRVCVYLLEGDIYVIVVMDSAVPLESVRDHIEQALQLTSKVFALLHHLQGNSSRALQPAPQIF